MRSGRVVPLTFAFMVCAACYKWAPVPGNAPLSGAAVSEEDTLRITPRAGSPVRIRAVSIQGDSLIGINAWDNARYAIATRDIETVEARQLGKSETLGAAFGGIVVIGGLVIGLALAALSAAPL